MSLPPKPQRQAERVSLWRYLRLFRRDILSAQPERLFRAWMAEFRTPFFRSYLINQPELLRTVLKDRPQDFPKSDRVSAGLRPLLGRSVFLTNGETWKRQRRIIDPAFEGGRLQVTFPAMRSAAEAAYERLSAHLGENVEVEAEMNHTAADVIFRTLFSLPIEDATARAVFEAFRLHQRSQPILNLGAFVPLPAWMPLGHRRATRVTARKIRALLTDLTDQRRAQIAAGTAPDDLATKIMTTPDPVSGACFTADEMVDQVAIFFLAGHETSGAALAWALYLLATNPDWQDRVAAEAQSLCVETVSDVAQLSVTRDVFRETLRLYPPVPMMVREAAGAEVFRQRSLRRGAQVVLSPWHLHRHERLWETPDSFDPGRWQTDTGRTSARSAFIPFSAGPRVCPGAGFAMIEGPLVLARVLRAFRVEPVEGRVPVPQAHLTIRARDGIWLRFVRR